MKTIRLVTLLAAALACAAPALGARATPPDSTSLDVRAFRALNEGAANPVFDAVMPILTDFDKWKAAVIVIWACLVILGKARGRWAALMLIPIIAASDQISSGLLKPLVERSRPCDALGGVHLWHGRAGWMTTPAVVTQSFKATFSFPSGHAANITASMLFLGLVYRRWLAPLLAVALLVSYSRIYIGVHWPSDVLVGMTLGALIAGVAYFIFTKAYREGTRPLPPPPADEPRPAGEEPPAETGAS